MQIMAKSKAIRLKMFLVPPEEATKRNKRKYVWKQFFFFAFHVFSKCQQYLYSQLHE